MKAEVDGGERGEITTPSRIKSTASTPRKPKTPKNDPLKSTCIRPSYSKAQSAILTVHSRCKR